MKNNTFALRIYSTVDWIEIYQTDECEQKTTLFRFVKQGVLLPFIRMRMT